MRHDSFQPGQLDRRITIEALTETKESDGSIVSTWTVLWDVWAERAIKRGREYFEAGRVLAEQRTVYRVRYLDGIGPRMRLRDGSRVFDIADTAELGRGGLLEIEVKELRTD